MRFGPWEIALILIIILIVFGVGRLPQVGEAIGKSIRAFKKSSQGEDEEVRKPSDDRTIDAKSDLEITKAKLEAAEAKVKALEATKKAEENKTT